MKHEGKIFMLGNLKMWSVNCFMRCEKSFLSKFIHVFFILYFPVFINLQKTRATADGGWKRDDIKQSAIKLSGNMTIRWTRHK